ncbi:MAG: transglutaminase domain-containing protein [Planctomycetes bacterium]|nr:transglutaminase domain-containing protein [Planctomycetota bacterium]MBL7144357.1 transglutaminase domain-containing protein [Phycisphaerae bacterium]
MKDKFLLGICFLLVVINVVGCRKKPESSPEPQQQTVGSMEESSQTQAEFERVFRDKLETEKPPAKVTASAIDVSEDQAGETEYFALFMEGKKVGYAIQSRDVDGDKVITSVELKITLNRIGVPVSVKTNAKTFETVEGKPLGFELVQAMGIIASKTTATIDEQGKVKVKTGQQEVEFDWPDGAVMSEGMRLLHLERGLTEGTTYNVKAFDPSMMQVVDVEVKVGSKQNVDLLGRVVALIEVTSTISLPQIGPMISTEYYDDELQLQKSVMPVMGMTIEQVACSKEFALGEIDVLEVVDKMFMKSPEPLGDVGSARSITYHLSPIQEMADLKIPSGDNQRVQRLSNGNLILTIEPVVAPKGVSFPYKGSDPEALEALKASRYVESDQKIIIDLAKRAVGRTSDAAEAISKIEAFVADYVEDKNLSVGYASAVEVASSKQGDCTEHAVLTAALCRAVGIPSQVVTGLAYVEEWSTVVNGFGGHAWAQAYVGDKWVGIDAAFKGTGRGGYDAGHIALAAGSGNPEDFLNLIGTMGQFKIDRVEVTKR